MCVLGAVGVVKVVRFRAAIAMKWALKWECQKHSQSVKQAARNDGTARQQQRETMREKLPNEFFCIFISFRIPGLEASARILCHRMLFKFIQSVEAFC